MQKLLKLEEVALFSFSIYFYNQLHYDWWLFLALILLPDASMLGYLFNSKIGAITYNIIHHKALAIIVWWIGLYTKTEVYQLAGIILFAHSTMDRIFGYGLKYFDGFYNTHLGLIGKAEKIK